MTEPHKRPYRHPKYKTAHRVATWREYDQALRDRGDITLWIRQDAIDAWKAPKTGKRGAQLVYADIAIETALALRLLFRLPLRQTAGFLHAILTLMDVTLPCPDHTTLSRRHATVAIQRQIDQLRVKRDESQAREVSLACQLLNRMRELGRPASYAVN